MRANKKTVPFSIRLDQKLKAIVEKYAKEKKTNDTNAMRSIILDWASRTEGFSTMLFFTDPDAWRMQVADEEIKRDMAINLLNGSKAYFEYSPKLLLDVFCEAKELSPLTDEETENLRAAMERFEKLNSNLLLEEE
jgi:hypothetical protein